jgi:hypothetical protein
MIRELAGTAMTDDCIGDFPALDVVQLLAPPSDASLGPCGGKTRRSALADHRSLKLGEGANHLHHHPPCWRGRVDVFGKGRLRRRPTEELIAAIS